MKSNYIGIYLISVFFASCAQIILKQSAEMEHESFIKEYMNFRVIIGYLILFVSTILTIIAYRGVELKMGPILESAGYIFVLLLSWLFFKERLLLNKIAGISFIIMGIIIFCL